MNQEKLHPILKEKLNQIEELPHTADVKYAIQGLNLNEAFEISGYAFSDTHVDIFLVEPIKNRDIIIESEDLFSLLFDFITELIYLLGAKNLIFCLFKNLQIHKESERYRLTTTAWGEELNLEKHDIKTEVKAMTYHQMEIDFASGTENFDDTVEITLVFDI